MLYSTRYSTRHIVWYITCYVAPLIFNMIKISLPTKIHSLPTKCTLCPVFHSLPRPTPSLPRPPPSLPSLLRSQGFWQLLLVASRAVQMHLFRLKEMDVLFSNVVFLLAPRTQPMGDNYRGSQSRTAWRTISVAVADGLAPLNSHCQEVGFICPFVVIDPSNLGATTALARNLLQD